MTKKDRMRLAKGLHYAICSIRSSGTLEVKQRWTQPYYGLVSSVVADLLDVSRPVTAPPNPSYSVDCKLLKSSTSFYMLRLDGDIK